MRKHCKAYLLPAVLVISLSIGCQSAPQEAAPLATAPVEIMIPLVTEAPAPEPTQTPAPTPELPPQEAFSALDQEVFAFLVSSDWYTLNNYLKNPEHFGIDVSAVPISWGSYSLIRMEEDLAAMEGYLNRLTGIDRESLDPREQVSYDVLEAYLETEIQKGKYPLFEEPLSPLGGLHSTIPLVLGLYPVESAEDARAYLKLLSDTPRYLAEILEFERLKAANGLFMTTDALITVLEQIEVILKERDYFYLYNSFSEALDRVPGLSDSDRAALVSENTLAVEGLMAAYGVLHQGLSELSSTCRVTQGLSVLGNEAEAYFNGKMNGLGGTVGADAEEVLNLLQEEVYHLSVSASLIRMEHPDALEELEDLALSDDLAKEVDYLKETAEALLGELPSHNLEIQPIPPALQSQSSPAMFVKPAIDSWTENRILLGFDFTSIDGYLALAHEGYPGHLYQFVLQRSITDLPVTQQILPLTGYYEGWSTVAERIFIENQGRFPRDGLKLYHYDTTVIQKLLPAIVSIRVNVMGDGIDEVKKYLKSYALEENAEAYYQYAIMDPYYYLPYAIGYAQLSGMLRQAENDLGTEFDTGEFLSAYLNYGPAQFPILREQMDIWIDEKFSH